MNPSINDWLSELGLPQYAKAFASNDIDWSLLPQLDQPTLQAIGITSAGHRLRILSAARELSAMEKSGSLAAERRQLTVMFCDLVDSTELSQRLDPEDLRDIVRAYQEQVEQVTAQFAGYIAQYLGDGVLVYFGYPVANENDAQNAAHAALTISSSLTALNKRLLPLHNVSLAVRIGLHTGSVVVGAMGGGPRTEQLAMGATPNQAARLQGLAKPDQVVISEQTAALLENQFITQSLGEHALKGIDTPVLAFALTGRQQPTSRFRASAQAELRAMIGREAELQRLQRHWNDAADGNGRLVLVTGEAGIGKSRITQELMDRITGDSVNGDSNTGQALLYQGSPHFQATALYPVSQQLQLAAGVSSNASTDSNFKRIASAFESDSQLTKFLFARLSGMGDDANSFVDGDESRPTDADEIRIQVIGAVVDHWLRLSREQPLLVVLEDAHWADASTLDIFRRALSVISTHRILLLVTARPEFTDSFGRLETVSQVSLNRLPREVVMQMAQSMSGDTIDLFGYQLTLIADRCDGIPLYVEEIVRAVLDHKSIRKDGYPVSSELSLQEIAIPGSLQDSLTARLDRLALAKPVAQAAACIGRQFSMEELLVISPVNEVKTREALTQLEAAEVVFHAPGSTERLIFKHALLRDAAYESLLKRQRRQYHRVLANYLQMSTHQGADITPERLAWQFSEAGDVVTALRYWELAAKQSIGQGAMNEAATHYRKAIRLLRHSVASSDSAQSESIDWPATELRLSLSLVALLPDLSGFGNTEARDLAKDAFEIAKRLDNHDAQVWALSLASKNEFLLGELEQSRLLLQSVQPESVRQATDLAYVHYLNACQHHEIKPHGLKDAVQAVDQALSMGLRLTADQPDNHVLRRIVFSLQLSGHKNLAACGKLEQAMRIEEQANQLTEQTTHGPTRGTGLIWQAVRCLWRLDWDRLERVVPKARALAERYNTMTNIFMTGYMQGLIGMRSNNAQLRDDGRKAVQKHFAAFRNWPGKSGTAHSLCWIANALSDIGDYDEMRRVVEFNQELITRIGAKTLLPTIQAQSGFLLIQYGKHEQAETLLRTNLAEFDGDQLLLHQLHVAVQIANLTETKDDLAALCALVRKFEEAPGWPILMKARELLKQHSIDT